MFLYTIPGLEDFTFLEVLHWFGGVNIFARPFQAELASHKFFILSGEHLSIFKEEDSAWWSVLAELLQPAKCAVETGGAPPDTDLQLELRVE